MWKSAFICLEVILLVAPAVFPSIPPLIAGPMFIFGLSGLLAIILIMLKRWLCSVPRFSQSTIKISIDDSPDCRRFTTNSVNNQQVLFYRARVETHSKNCRGFLTGVKVKSLKGKWIEDRQFAEAPIPLSWSLSQNKTEAGSREISSGEKAYLDLFVVTESNEIGPGTYQQKLPNSLNGLFNNKNSFMLCIRVKSDNKVQDINIIAEKGITWDDIKAYEATVND